MEERYVMFGILGLVLVSAFAVVMNNSITGNAASNAYGINKVYGPGIKNSYMTPTVYGKAHLQEIQMYQNQQFLINILTEENKNKYCVYDSPEGPNPCMFDVTLQKWCCVPYGTSV